MHLKTMIIALSVFGLVAESCALSNAVTTVVADETATVGGIDDLPMMPGFSEVTSNRVVFDKPEGRIIVAVARSATPCTSLAVSAYYSQALATRGWSGLPSGKPDESAFVRDHERLDIQSECGGEDSAIRFLLYPLELFSSSTSP